MRGWLLDTNVVSELRKGAQRCTASVWIWAASVPRVSTFLARMIIVELRVGIETATDPALRAALEVWLRDDVRTLFAGRILEADEDVLLTWRRLMTAGRGSRYTYSPPDALIAATALHHGLGVATRNVADFERAGVPVLNPWKPPAR